MAPLRALPILLALLLGGGGAPAAPPETVAITILQLHDIYEITPVSGGRSGGVARVATVRRRLLAQNPRTLTVLAGDCFSPSALGTASVDGEPLAGAQMVAALNALGLDYATLGNHEFDLSARQFGARVGESRFRWFSGNVLDRAGKPFPGVSAWEIREARGDQGATVRIGLVGAMLPTAGDYFTVRDPVQALREQVALLRDKVDILIAVTHLPVDGDCRVAEQVPGIDLILGGHEHENVQLRRGSAFTPILKADANARSVFIHELRFDTGTRRLAVTSRLEPVTDAVPEDPAVAGVVAAWVKRGFDAFRRDGFEPEAGLGATPVALDGLEASVRSGPTDLTRLIGRAMLRAAGGADLALLNGGSIRIDDVIPPGPVTQYDVIRILPFGGKLLTIGITGALLRKALDQGLANRGNGGFLQTAGAVRDPKGAWSIGGAPLDPLRTYRAVVNDFLVTGRELGLDFLVAGTPGIEKLAEHGDIRFAVIRELRAQAPAP